MKKTEIRIPEHSVEFIAYKRGSVTWNDIIRGSQSIHRKVDNDTGAIMAGKITTGVGLVALGALLF